MPGILGKLEGYYNTAIRNRGKNEAKETYQGPKVGNDSSGAPVYESNLNQAIQSAQRRVRSPNLDEQQGYSLGVEAAATGVRMGGIVFGSEVLVSGFRDYLGQFAGESAGVAPYVVLPILAGVLTGVGIYKLGNYEQNRTMVGQEKELDSQGKRMQEALKKIRAGGGYLEKALEKEAKLLGFKAYSRPDEKQLKKEMREVSNSIRDYGANKRDDYMVIVPSRTGSYKFVTRS